MTKDVSIISLALLLGLTIPIFFANYLIKLQLNKKIVISIVRMGVQLAFVGIYLQYIFKWNNPVVNVAYLIIMMIIASAHSIKSSSLKLKLMFIPIFLSVALPQFIVLFTFNLLVGGKEQIFDAKLIVPVGGMLLGNCLNGNIIALNTFYTGIKNDEKKYNYSLALGASHYQALAPYFRQSLNIAILPTIASIATTGLVSLPGMMTGQILAGSLPLTAIKYQGAIMVSILSAKYFSVLLSLYFSKSKGFNNLSTLNREIFNN